MSEGKWDIDKTKISRLGEQMQNGQNYDLYFAQWIQVICGMSC